MEISGIRRQSLRKWFSERPVPEKEKSYLSQLMTGKASFGERAARRLEREYGMGAGYLDTSWEPEGVQKVLMVSSPMANGWGVGKRPVQRKTAERSCDETYVNFDLLEEAAWIQYGTADVECQKIKVLESWARNTLGGADLSHIKLIACRGTAMQGTIDNGDLVFVDATVRSYDGEGLYVIAHAGGVQIKRLQKLHGNALALISDNKLFDSEKLSSEESQQLQICGRVMAAWAVKKFW